MTIGELCDLWFDDELTDGVRSVQLVVAVCRLTRPKRILELAERFYPGVPWPEIPGFERGLLERGFTMYRS